MIDLKRKCTPAIFATFSQLNSSLSNPVFSKSEEVVANLFFKLKHGEIWFNQKIPTWSFYFTNTWWVFPLRAKYCRVEMVKNKKNPDMGKVGRHDVTLWPFSQVFFLQFFWKVHFDSVKKKVRTKQFQSFLLDFDENIIFLLNLMKWDIFKSN